MKFLTLCVCLILSGPLLAQEKDTVSGVLQKIDVQTGTITIRPGKMGAKEAKTFNLLKPDIEVTTDKGRVRLADLAPGNIVHLHLRGDDDVDAIRVDIAVLRGAITAIGAADKTIRILSEDLVAKTVQLNANTKIVQNEKSLEIADLKPNQWVEITSTLDGKTAQRIELHPAGSKNPRLFTGRLQGKIVSLDVAAGTVLFHQTKGKEGKERLFSFAAPPEMTMWLVSDKRPLDILRGPQPIASQSAAVYLGPNRTDVKRILISAEAVHGQVKSVDLANRKLVVDSEGKTLTWDVANDVTVLDGKRKTKLDSVRANAQVDLLLSLDRTKLRGIVMTAPR